MVRPGVAVGWAVTVAVPAGAVVAVATAGDAAVVVELVGDAVAAMVAGGVVGAAGVAVCAPPGSAGELSSFMTAAAHQPVRATTAATPAPIIANRSHRELMDELLSGGVLSIGGRLGLGYFDDTARVDPLHGRTGKTSGMLGR